MIARTFQWRYGIEYGKTLFGRTASTLTAGVSPDALAHLAQAATREPPGDPGPARSGRRTLPPRINTHCVWEDAVPPAGVKTSARGLAANMRIWPARWHGCCSHSCVAARLLITAFCLLTFARTLPAAPEQRILLVYDCDNLSTVTVRGDRAGVEVSSTGTRLVPAVRRCHGVSLFGRDDNVDDALKVPSGWREPPATPVCRTAPGRCRGKRPGCGGWKCAPVGG